MKNKFLSLVILIFIGTPLISNAELVNTMPVDAKQAISKMYGGQKWHDKKLFEFLKTDIGYVIPQFWSKYSEDGVERLLVIVSIEPQETPHENHMPLLGGAILKKVDSNWIIESENKILGWGGKHDDIGSVSIVRVGKEKYGIEVNEWDEIRGFEGFSTRVFIPIGRKLKLALEISAGGPEGDGPCENKNFPPQSLSINYVPIAKLEYFDIYVSASYNDGGCENNVRKEIQTKYHLRNGKYIPI